MNVRWTAFTALTVLLISLFPHHIGADPTDVPTKPSGTGSLPVQITDPLVEAAMEDPFDDDRLQPLLNSLSKYDGRYIIENDIRATEEEVAERLASIASGDAAAPVGEALVDLKANGEFNIWPRGKRDITYSFDKRSFGANELKILRTNIARAASDWQNACSHRTVTFKHWKNKKFPRQNPTPHFVVRMVHDAGFIASAFFPDDGPADMYLLIDASYFTSGYDKVGLLRHELGHVLGFRHEHSLIYPICSQEKPTNAKLLTASYDPNSVMHYLCGGGGTAKLELSPGDKRTFCMLYK